MRFDGRAPKLLIIDDNRINRKKVKLSVENLGFEADVCADGETGLRTLAEQEYDAVLLDMLMPVMDGFEVLRRLKDDEKLRELPVVIISDLEEDTESVSRAIELGAEDFLPKAYDPTILYARLNASLRKKWFRDQELEYFSRINKLTDAASRIEAGRFDSEALQLQDEAKKEDPIGRLAMIFQGMAREIHAREVSLLNRIRTLQGAILLLIAGVASGLTPSLSRLAAGMGSNPFGMAAWVDLFALIACSVIVLFRGNLPKIRLRDCWFFATWGFMVGILQHITVFVLAEHVEATYLTLVLALESLFVFAFVAVARLDVANMRRVLGLVLGLTGVGASLYHRLEGDSVQANFWLIATIAAPLIYALETLVLAAKKPDTEPVTSVGLMFAFSCVFAFPLALLSGNFIPAAIMFTELGAVIAALSIVSVAANVAYLHLLDFAGAVFASQTAYATALAGIIWGVVLLDERMEIFAWGAVGLVLLGMWLVEAKQSDAPIIIRRDFTA